MKILGDGRIIGQAVMSGTLSNGDAGITITNSAIKSTSVVIGTRVTNTFATGARTIAAYDINTGSASICMDNATTGDTLNYMIIP